MNKFDSIDFLCSLIRQCPDNSIFEMTCNFDINYSRVELLGSVLNNDATIQNCNDDRQREVLKSSLLENYKISEDRNGTKLWEHGLNLLVKEQNKETIIKILSDNFDNADICHCNVYPNNDLTQDKIAECYDGFNHSVVDSKHFKFTDSDRQLFEENTVDIYFDKMS
jgi:hypothetical protein